MKYKLLNHINYKVLLQRNRISFKLAKQIQFVISVISQVCV